jgi:hypothetical protein
MQPILPAVLFGYSFVIYYFVFYINRVLAKRLI